MVIWATTRQGLTPFLAGHCRLREPRPPRRYYNNLAQPRERELAAVVLRNRGTAGSLDYRNHVSGTAGATDRCQCTNWVWGDRNLLNRTHCFELLPSTSAARSQAASGTGQPGSHALCHKLLSGTGCPVPLLRIRTLRSSKSRSV